MHSKLKAFSFTCCVIIFTCLSCNNNKSRHFKKLSTSVISHYKKDSLKTKAAEFLLKNIEEKHSLSDKIFIKYKDTIDRYYKENPDTLHIKLRSLRSIDNNNLPKIYDTELLSTDYIISNIDLAFQYWENAPWQKEISFSNFCEYILPYRHGNEKIENWRELALNDTIFSDYKDSFPNDKSLIEFATEVMIKLSKSKKGFKTKWGSNSANLPDLPFSSLDKITTGTCSNKAQLSIYYGRAIGLPITCDFTPQWANHYAGHEWTVLITKSKNLQFIIPIRKELGTNAYSDNRIPSKVYRKIFSINKNTHVQHFGVHKNLPDLFNNPNLIDVTEEYEKVIDINIPVKYNTDSLNVAYLSVSQKLGWNPIDWAYVKNGMAEYKKIPNNAVFLPVSITPTLRKHLNYPFYIDSNKNTHFLKPNLTKTQTVILKRKYPLNAIKIKYIQRMIDGEFHLSNDKDFNEFTVIYRIKETPFFHANPIVVNTNKRYRYLRYYAANYTRCNIAEIEVFDQQGQINLNGEKLGEELSEENLIYAFDKEPLTYVDMSRIDKLWIGVDLEFPRQITKINFVPRNDKNHIIPGHLYELFYWNNLWHSLGKKVADSYELVYDNIPTNCLLYLKNHTEGTEERIFTYENGTQIWW